MSPSTYMRGARPENYSDTVVRTSYVLEEAVLSNHLETITSRNQTHDFEIFCRKLCERAICPNLRPQTGPDGGGDSKADSETVPVADEITIRTFIGDPIAGREKWAFAFSAKADWAAKAKSDIAGIAGTQRGYERVFFITSRFAKAKTRAKLEQDLSAEHGFGVTIHDRTWIMQQVLEFDRRDLAFNYLHVGQEVTAGAPLGPNDYSRGRQLEDIEKALDDHASFAGMRIQEAAEALVAAKLSRSLEKPRFETEGRFARAVRLADAHGTTRQKMEARYEALWTAVWWFDDIAHLNAHYDAIESLIIADDNAANLQFLSNLVQMLINAVLHEDFTRDECKLDARLSRLNARLEELMVDKARPNNALECESMRLHGRLNAALLAGDQGVLSALWPQYCDILARARSLGEFDVRTFVKMIEVVGIPAGNDPAYTALVEEAAAFIGERTGSAEGAMLLLRRAQKLTPDDKFEMIRLAGKAARQLTKKEYAGPLIAALFLLAQAYRSAGLLWAARATCVFGAASIVIEGEADSELDVRIVPALELFAWISLELRYIPDFLHAVQFLNGCLAGLPLDDAAKERLKEALSTLDLALGSHFLNTAPADLAELGVIPDVLEALGLFMARTSLLYAMGHESVLRADGSLPPEETEAPKIFAALASQPVSEDIRGPLITNSGGPQHLQATVMGMVVDVSFDGSTATTLIAEAITASVEACFATGFELDVHPHTERFEIAVVEADRIKKPSLAMDEARLTATVKWPRGMSPLDYDGSGVAIRFFTHVALMTMAATCVMHSKDVIKKLADDEAVFDRISMIAVTGNSYHRMFSQSVARITDWQDTVQQTYPLQSERPKIERITLPDENDVELKPAPKEATEEQRKAWLKDASHRDVHMRSVIDYHLWNKAGWRGALYMSTGENTLPVIGLMFTNEEAARAIFGRWRERFGEVDREDEIYLSILKDVSPTHPLHYTMLVSSNPAKFKANSAMIMTRMHRMEAVTDVHVRHFLADYERMGVYLLMPAIFKGDEPEPLFDLMILKRNLVVKSAKSIGPNEIERVALIDEANSHLEGDSAA